MSEFEKVVLEDEKDSLNELSEEEARQWIQSEIDKERTQTDIARAMGIGLSSLNRFIKGNYPNPKSIIEKVASLRNTETKRKLSPDIPKFSPTSITDKITQIIEFCNVLQSGGVIAGAAGIGKTTAIRQYAKNNPLAICINASQMYSTPSAINRLLAEELGCRSKDKLLLYKELIYKLKGSKRILLIDEAQFLKRQTLDHIRTLMDESQIAYVFIGNSGIYETIKGKQAEDFEQVENRLYIPDKIFTVDIKKEDIESIFKESRLDDESIDYLYKISKTKQAIRGVTKLYTATIAFYDDITRANLVKAARELNMRV